MPRRKPLPATPAIADRIVELRRVPASSLLPHPANWRRHPQAQRDALSGVLAEIGFADALLTRQTPDGLQLVDGHLRRDLLGDQEVPVLVLDLDDAEAEKLLVTLDPLAAMAQHDQEALWSLLESVSFDSQAVTDMLEALANDERLPLGNRREPPADPGAQIDRAAELQQKWQTALGQLWEIPSSAIPGKAHRLMCGDSARRDDVLRLMQQQKASLFATDPPYGIDYDSAQLHVGGSHYDAIQHDDLKDERFQSWLEGCFKVWAPFLLADAAWYLWHPMLIQGHFAAAALNAADVLVFRQIVWIKPQLVFGRGEYHWRHEVCFYGWRRGHRPPFYGEHNQSTVWNVEYDGNRNQRDHPTQKPAELFAIPMRNHNRMGDICAEPFSGSGTQLVAAEQTGCLCYGMEIDPEYVAVALQRLADMGLGPKLLLQS